MNKIKEINLIRPGDCHHSAVMLKVIMSEITFVTFVTFVTINDHSGNNNGIGDKGGHGVVLPLVIALIVG